MHREHSLLREGLITGLIGAVVVAAWYFVIDTAAGDPFHTPNVLGKIFFQGEVGPAVRTASAPAVAAYTALHLLMYILAGLGLTILAHQASRNLGLRMGVWIGLVIAWCFFAGVTFTLFTLSGERLPLWTVIIGSLLGPSVMTAYLWRRHPRLGTPFQDRAQGHEAEAPPHPQGGPQA